MQGLGRAAVAGIHCATWDAAQFFKCENQMCAVGFIYILRTETHRDSWRQSWSSSVSGERNCTNLQVLMLQKCYPVFFIPLPIEAIKPVDSLMKHWIPPLSQKCKQFPLCLSSLEQQWLCILTAQRKKRSPVCPSTLPVRRDGGVLPWRKTTCQGQFETCLLERQAQGFLVSTGLWKEKILWLSSLESEVVLVVKSDSFDLKCGFWLLMCIFSGLCKMSLRHSDITSDTWHDSSVLSGVFRNFPTLGTHGLLLPPK